MDTCPDLSDRTGHNLNSLHNLIKEYNDVFELKVTKYTFKFKWRNNEP